MASEMEAAMSKAISYVSGFQSKYSSQMENVRAATELTITKVNGLIERYKDLAKEANAAAEAERNYQEAKGQSNYSGSGGGTSSKGTSGTSNILKADPILTFKEEQMNNTNKTNNTSYQTIKTSTGGHYTVIRGSNGKEIMNYAFYENQNLTIDGYKTDLVDVNGTKMRLYRISSPKGFVGGTAQDGTGYINQKDLNELLGNATDTKLYNKYHLKSLDTGGYTGSWGPEGRLAMLHQKEIVLNAHDTENFLTAIGIVRDISDQIEKNALVMASQNAFANYKAQVNHSSDTLQQEVTIHAEFPNATNHSEIEEAFRNLTNYASQYANRKS